MNALIPFAGNGMPPARRSLIDLNAKIAALQAQKASLDAVIKQDQIYENRKKALESRIKIIESLP